MDSKKPIEIFIILVVYDLAYIKNVLLRELLKQMFQWNYAKKICNKN